MRPLYAAIPLAALAFLLPVPDRPGTAQTVAPHTRTGKVAEVDRQSGVLVLRDGGRYELGESTTADTIAEGDEVDIEYRILGDRRVAVRIAPLDVGEAESMGAGDTVSGEAERPRTGPGQHPAAGGPETAR